MKLTIAIGLAALLCFAGATVACNHNAGPDPKAVADDHRTNGAEFQQRAGDIYYAQDPRTGLCFAGESLRTQYATLATVPCSPDVLAQIVR